VGGEGHHQGCQLQFHQLKNPPLFSHTPKTAHFGFAFGAKTSGENRKRVEPARKKGKLGEGAMGNPEERPEKSMATAESQLCGVNTSHLHAPRGVEDVGAWHWF